MSFCAKAGNDTISKKNIQMFLDKFIQFICDGTREKILADAAYPIFLINSFPELFMLII